MKLLKTWSYINNDLLITTFYLPCSLYKCYKRTIIKRFKYHSYYIDNHIDKFQEFTTFENEYPSEYITQADDEHKKFKEDENCCEHCAPLSLPYVFYLYGSLCTQTGTQLATAEPPPWKSVPAIKRLNKSYYFICV